MSKWIISERCCSPADQSGFTMVEMLIALVVSSIIMVAVYTSSKTQQDSYLTQDEVVIDATESAGRHLVDCQRNSHGGIRSDRKRQGRHYNRKSRQFRVHRGP